MNKNLIKTISYIALAGAGIGAVLYYRSQKAKKSQKEDYGDTEKEIKKTGGEVTGVDESEYSAKDKVQGSSFPLKAGSKGRSVAILQAVLNRLHGHNLKIDGALGSSTRSAMVSTGQLSCALARTCEISKYDWSKLVLEAKKDSGFKKYFQNNTGAKAVYKKYSS